MDIINIQAVGDGKTVLVGRDFRNFYQSFRIPHLSLFVKLFVEHSLNL
jgi:hypothetical protein